MIQSAAPTSHVSSAKAVGNAHGASAKTAGTGSFSAILGTAGADDTASTDTDDTTDAANDVVPAALLQAVADGKPGKASGKILPDAANASSGKDESDSDTDTEQDPPEATQDQAGIPPVLAGILSLPLPPLSGTGPLTKTQSRAAGSASTATARTPTVVQTPGTAAAANTNAATIAAANAAILVPATKGEYGAVKLPDGDAAKASANTASAPAVPSVKLAPIEIVSADATADSATAQAAKVPTASATAAQLATRASVTSAAASASAAAVTPAEQGNHARHSGNRTTDTSGLTRASTDATKLSTKQQIAAQTPAADATPMPVVAQHVQVETNAVATSAATPSQTVDGPQDFATLVSRLNEAREAASPQLVRTAITHSEFGQISLQFRHEDNGLAVTMANSDPGFAGAVQAAAHSAMAGNANSNSDTSPSQQQQQQQQQNQASSQQQAAANGAGAGMGNGAGQNQQARADQANQSMNRGQGTASFSQDQKASETSQPRDGTRRGSGLYA